MHRVLEKSVKLKYHAFVLCEADFKGVEEKPATRIAREVTTRFNGFFHSPSNTCCYSARGPIYWRVALCPNNIVDQLRIRAAESEGAGCPHSFRRATE